MPASNTARDTTSESNIFDFPDISEAERKKRAFNREWQEIKQIVNQPAENIVAAIQEIGQNTKNPEQTTEKIIRIVEQTINDKRELSGLAAASVFERMEPKFAARALTALFMKAGLGEDNSSTAIRRSVVAKFGKIGTPDALNRLTTIVAPLHPTDAVQGIADFKTPETPEIIASIAAEQSTKGRLTALQSVAMNLLVDLHRNPPENISSESIQAAAETLANAIVLTLEKSLEGGEQYRGNVLDYRTESELRPDSKDLTDLAATFLRAKITNIIPEQTVESLNKGITEYRHIQPSAHEM